MPFSGYAMGTQETSSASPVHNFEGRENIHKTYWLDIDPVWCRLGAEVMTSEEDRVRHDGGTNRGAAMSQWLRSFSSCKVFAEIDDYSDSPCWMPRMNAILHKCEIRLAGTYIGTKNICAVTYKMALEPIQRHY
jgi:hypothetical protein